VIYLDTADREEIKAEVKKIQSTVSVPNMDFDLINSYGLNFT